MPEVKSDVKNVKANKIAVKTAKKEKTMDKRVAGLKRFFIETKAEFKKIVWPAPKQVLNNTVVVLAMIVFVGAIIWILDTASTTVLTTFLKKYS